MYREKTSKEVFRSLLQHDWDFAKQTNTNTVFSLHPYPAKFIPEIPRNLIKDIGLPDNSIILDPFCGSGTTLVVAQEMGYPSIGIDLNPIACLISEVVTSPCPKNLPDRANQCIIDAEKDTEKHWLKEIPNIDHWFKKDVQLTLSSLLNQIDKIQDYFLKNALRVALSSIVVRVSNQESDTRYAAIEKKVTSTDVYDLFRKSCERYSQHLKTPGYCLPHAKVINKDILEVKEEDFPSKVGLVVCSPPYPNAYEYWLYHKYRMWLLGFDPLEVKNKEIGARPHYFRKNPHGPQDFEKQMSQVFGLLSKVCIPYASVCFVLGDSKIHGKIVDNTHLLVNAASSYDFELKAIIPRVISPSRKSFNLSHARIQNENIVIFQRKKDKPGKTETDLFWHNYSYFPYEKKFALREIAALSGLDSVIIASDRVRLTVLNPKLEEFSSLVYFSRYKASNSFQGSTKQSLVERTTSQNGNGKKQSTRYSVHGLHEFKGKFNPQIVRGILNWYNLPKNSCIIDPFLGSGTTLVEAIFAGHQAYGWDLNPLAVYITNAKLQILATPLSVLKELAEKILKGLNSNRKGTEADDLRSSYLSKWFSEDILIEIESASTVIDEVAAEFAPVFKTVYSNLLRDYSLQEPSDLRIRRRKSPSPSLKITARFEQDLHGLFQCIEHGSRIYPDLTVTAKAINADGRNYDEVKKNLPEGFFADFAFTSPPYATALPYIDTQRLSLIWLDLIPADKILQTESSLIGSRESSKTEFARLKDNMIENRLQLPFEIAHLCSKLQNQIGIRDGFRRQAVPTLLYRYFSDMNQTFNTVHKIVKTDAHYALIVGKNETTLGDKKEIIDAPSLLVKIAETCGWYFVEKIDLETYKRFGLHAANAIKQESLVVLRK